MGADLILKPQPGLERKAGPRGGRGHWYLNGRQCSGVTTATSIIEKPALLGWAAEMGAEYVRSVIGGYVERGEPIPSGEFEAALIGAKAGYRAVSEKAKAGGTKVDGWINDHIRARMAAAMPGAEPFKGADLPSAVDEPAVVRSINAFLEWEGSEDVRWLGFQHAAADPTFLIVGISDWWAEVGTGSARRNWVGDTKASKGTKVYPEWELQISTNLYVAGIGGTLSTVTPPKRPEDHDAFLAQLGEIGRADLICDKLTGGYHFGETVTDIRNDWENVLRAAGLRQRIPSTWN